MQLQIELEIDKFTPIRFLSSLSCNRDLSGSVPVIVHPSSKTLTKDVVRVVDNLKGAFKGAFILKLPDQANSVCVDSELHKFEVEKGERVFCCGRLK